MAAQENSYADDLYYYGCYNISRVLTVSPFHLLYKMRTVAPACTVLHSVNKSKDKLEPTCKYDDNKLFLLCTSLIVLLHVWAIFQIELN